MILIVDCGSSKTPYIAQAVDEFCDYTVTGIFDLHAIDRSAYKGMIISGAPILITEVDMQPYLDAIHWLTTTHFPTLGICFGHQLLGLLHGAYASKMREDRDWQLIEVYENCALFDRLPSEVEFMEDHCETISIPSGFQLVASSDACINECMQHREKPFFGVQFHPEVSGNHGRVLIENFVRISGAQ